MAEVMIAGFWRRVSGSQHIIASNRHATAVKTGLDRDRTTTTTSRWPGLRMSSCSVTPGSGGRPEPAQGPVSEAHHGAEHRGGRHADPSGIPHRRVAHACPTCSGREGMTVWAAPKPPMQQTLRASHRSSVSWAASSVPDEDVDMATAVNGTGPAIIAQFVKAMMMPAFIEVSFVIEKLVRVGVSWVCRTPTPRRLADRRGHQPRRDHQSTPGPQARRPQRRDHGLDRCRLPAHASTRPGTGRRLRRLTLLTTKTKTAAEHPGCRAAGNQGPACRPCPAGAAGDRAVRRRVSASRSI